MTDQEVVTLRQHLEAADRRPGAAQPGLGLRPADRGARRMRIEAYLDLVLRVGIGVSVLVAAWLAR